LISRNREFDIIDLFSDMHPADIADLIDELDEDDRLRLFSLLDVGQGLRRDFWNSPTAPGSS
jgi:Mg/Co/Ni transporter MgtE